MDLFKRKRTVYEKNMLTEIYFRSALKEEEYWAKEDLKNAHSAAEKAKLQKRLDRIQAAKERQGNFETIVQMIPPTDSFDVLDFIEKFQKEQAVRLAHKKGEKMKRDRKELDGGKKGLLGTLRKHAIPILASLGLLELFTLGGIENKKRAAGAEQTRIEQQIKSERLSQFPKEYKKRGDALISALVLNQALGYVGMVQEEIEESIDYAKIDIFRALKERIVMDREWHPSKITERAIALACTELKELNLSNRPVSDLKKVKDLQERMQDALLGARDGHGLIKRGTKWPMHWGTRPYHSASGLEASVYSNLEKNYDPSDWPERFREIDQELQRDNAPGHAQTPRTGGRGL